jgi:hypothetical protein
VNKKVISAGKEYEIKEEKKKKPPQKFQSENAQNEKNETFEEDFADLKEEHLESKYEDEEEAKADPSETSAKNASQESENTKATSDQCTTTMNPSEEKTEENKLLCSEYGTIFYTDIPHRKVIHGLTGAQLTQINFDKTTILMDLISKEYHNNYTILLAELQFSFISFVLGHNLESLNQWKNIIVLLCSCEKAMILLSYRNLYLDFISKHF